MTVRISKKEHQELLDCQEKLQLLEAVGVVNWYGEALKSWFAKIERHDMFANALCELDEMLAEATIDHPAGPGAGHVVDYDRDQVVNLLERLVKRAERINKEHGE